MIDTHSHQLPQHINSYPSASPNFSNAFREISSSQSGCSLLEVVKHLEESYGCGWGQGLLEEVEYFLLVVGGQVGVAEAAELGNLWFSRSCCHF